MKNIFVHLGFLLIILGVSLIFVDSVSASINNYYDDIEESKRIIKNVDTLYEQFKEDAIDVKNGIVDISKSFNVYFDDFDKANKSITEKIENVKEKINQVNVVATDLINNCRYQLNDINMNNQCKNFKINYTNMMSSYETMVDQYNKVITSYNNYATRKGKVSIAIFSKEIEGSKAIIELIK